MNRSKDRRPGTPRRRLIRTAVAAAILGCAGSAQAANWLMLQGTESPKAPDFKAWGFMQPAYTDDRSPALSELTGGGAANNGKHVANDLIGPELNDQQAFHVRRARVGARGRFNEDINYFALFELANNGLTFAPFGDRVRTVAFSDFSLTFNELKGARIRAGLFKNPGSEELLQAIHVFDYIEFTDFNNRDNLERFASGAIQPAGSPAAPTLGTGQTKGYGFSAARDWGVQVFDSFKKDAWDLSYAVKVGRGEDLHTADDGDFDPELYLYGSAEYDLPGGKGAMKNGIKVYAWHQQGKRQFETDATHTKYDRIRQGVGFKALGKLFGTDLKQRVSGELMYADGMIFVAPSGNVKGGALQYAAEKGNKARGWYLDYGIYPTQKWEFDVRYDRNDLLYQTSSNVNVGNEREISAWTFGVNYHFSPKVRLTFNYIARDAKAPTDYVATGAFTAGAATATTNNVHKIVDTLEDRVALQLTWIF